MAIPYGQWLNAQGRSMVDSVNSLAKGAQDKLSQATAETRAGYKTLVDADPSASTQKMRGYGDEIAGVAKTLPGYAETIKSLAGGLVDNAGTLTDSGRAALGIGSDLTGMNRDSSNELVRALVSNIDQYNPENRVSFAAQDVMNSFKTGEGQLERQMSRSGVNPSAGRNAALRQQYQIALNTALAAAKTRARQAGLGEQTAALSQLASLGMSFGNQGKDFLAAANAATANAIGAQNTAAAIEKSSADLFGAAASIEGSASNIDTGHAARLASQSNTIAAALQREGLLLDSRSARELAFLQADLASTPVKTSTSTGVYTDISGNKVYSSPNNQVVTVVNKTGNGWELQSNNKR